MKGCTLHCKNCINPELWSSNNPNLLSINSIINQLQSKHITLLGGEPLQQKDIFPFIKELKKNNIGIILFLGMLITGVPVGCLIDHIADKCDFPNEDYYSPPLWAILGLVWPVTLLPFLVYCLWYKKKTE